MVKRKELEQEELKDSVSAESSSEESNSDDDTDMLDVEFEWFDPQPEHDFHGFKTLLRQLFDVDAQLFDLSALTNLILSQPLLGSTVKVEGNETDPYAFLTVLNLHEHRDKPVIRHMTEYLTKQSSLSASLTKLHKILATTNEFRIGLILTERLVNIPSEVVPPMYKMLLEEISWAVEDREPYNFTHYLVFSKTYRECISVLDENSTPKSKKQKKASGKGSSEIFYFHPEDEVLHQYSVESGSFEYSKGAGRTDAISTFQDLGIKPEGHLILIEAAKFEAAVRAIQEYYGQT